MTGKGCGRLFCAQIWQNLKQKAAALPMVGKAAALIALWSSPDQTTG